MKYFTKFGSTFGGTQSTLAGSGTVLMLTSENMKIQLFLINSFLIDFLQFFRLNQLRCNTHRLA